MRLASGHCQVPIGRAMISATMREQMDGFDGFGVCRRCERTGKQLWAALLGVIGVCRGRLQVQAKPIRFQPLYLCVRNRDPPAAPPPPKNRLVTPRASLASSDNLSLLKVRLFRLPNHTRGGREASRRGWIGPGKRHYRSRCRALRAMNARQELSACRQAKYFLLLPQSSTNASVFAEVDKIFWTSPPSPPLRS
jgi:hypothetical protein